jgi:predicted small metal-binding protein
MIRRKGLRAKGHALRMEWSGEYGQESSSTGFCRCGWEESSSSQDEVRNEYAFHLRKVLAKQAEEAQDLTPGILGSTVET